MRAGVGQETLEDAAFLAGSALAALDPLARGEDPVGQLWRRRLALQAAATVVAFEGRRGDAAQIRDHWALRRPGDDPGPAGRLLAAWRYLGEARALRTQDWPERLPAQFDLAAEDASQTAIREIGLRFPGRNLPVRHAALAAASILRLGPTHRALALWLADAVLARGLGWDRPVPLLAAHLRRADLRLATGEAGPWLTACCLAWARGAIAAVDLHAELARRADRLRAVAPKLRGRDAQAMVARLLTEDAVAAQAGAAASDRAARRFFDRLTGLGVVRELTGRPTFRLYGL